MNTLHENNVIQPHFFKYKSLSGDSFKYFLKMLIESQLYAAKFSELNDPMEGVFRSSNRISNEVLQAIKTGKTDMRIISLVKKGGLNDKPCKSKMWSHYADEHRGCCIEFHFKDNEDDRSVINVGYKDQINEILEIRECDDNAIKSFLSIKLKEWEDENEVRYLGKKTFVPIEIDKIYLGMRIDDIYNDTNKENETFYKKIISRINSQLQDKIEIMTFEDFNDIDDS